MSGDAKIWGPQSRALLRKAEAENKRLREEIVLLAVITQERDELRKVVEAIETGGDNPDLWGALVKQRDEGQAEVERLRAFLRDRVADGLLKKHGGYHGRRIHMEAKQLLTAEAKEGSGENQD